MKKYFGIAFILLLAGCFSDTETAGGGDDFPNSIGPVLAQGLIDWGNERTVRPDQEGISEESVVLTKKASQSLIAETALSFDLSDSANGRVTIYAADTTVLKITEDTLTIAWNEAAKDTIKDNESIYYFSTRTTRRATGATEYQKMEPLDEFIKAPDLDSSRIRMKIIRKNWRKQILEGSGNLNEVINIDFVRFPDDTLSDYPTFYREFLSNGTYQLENTFISASGDSIFSHGESLIMRKVLLANGDSITRTEIGFYPGSQPWHGSARFHSFRIINYVPDTDDWTRVEILYQSAESYSENETIREGSFKLTLARGEGTWILEGSFDSTAFSGILTGPDGTTQEFHYAR